VTDRATKSISQENTFERDIRAQEVLLKYLDEMSEGVARELAHEELKALVLFSSTTARVRHRSFKSETMASPCQLRRRPRMGCIPSGLDCTK
jgi:nucleotidyltransferase/DNA polymerase involved in DNA repair